MQGKRITLVPAYGRDYSSLAKLKSDFNAGFDFLVRDISSPYDGRYANKVGLLNDNVTQVTVRYDKLRKVGVFNLS